MATKKKKDETLETASKTTSSVVGSVLSNEGELTVVMQSPVDPSNNAIEYLNEKYGYEFDTSLSREPSVKGLLAELHDAAGPYKIVTHSFGHHLYIDNVNKRSSNDLIKCKLYPLVQPIFQKTKFTHFEKSPIINKLTDLVKDKNLNNLLSSFEIIDWFSDLADDFGGDYGKMVYEYYREDPPVEQINPNLLGLHVDITLVTNSIVKDGVRGELKVKVHVIQPDKDVFTTRDYLGNIVADNTEVYWEYQAIGLLALHHFNKRLNEIAKSI